MTVICEREIRFKALDTRKQSIETDYRYVIKTGCPSGGAAVVDMRKPSKGSKLDSYARL